MKYVPKSVTRAVGRTVLRTQKNSPTLLFVAGIGGVIGATVLACKATLQVEEILTEHEKQKMEIGHSVKRPGVAMASDEIDVEQRKLMLKTAGQFMKIYAPPAIVMSISVMCLTKSHRILTDRNAQLSAAYVGLQKFLEGYRGRVREKVGAEEERNLYQASTAVELVEDTPTGPQKVYGNSPGTTPYSCVFDDTKEGLFQDNYDFNRHFIRLQEGHLTNRLRARGFLFLNEAYSAFDVKPTAIGQLVGWYIGHPDSDDFVEISVSPIHDGRGSLHLDFNVAGSVYEMLGNGSDNDDGFRKKLTRRRS